MAKKDPFNITLLDINKVIKDENLMEVTSEFIKESSSNKFHPEGLFSEQIFGEIASQKRIKQCGYIKLNCRVFHPLIYQNLRAIRRFYIDIMAGTQYAIWDADQCDFVRASETERGADTGFSFFLKYFDKINFTKNLSLRRGDKIDVITKFKNIRLIDKLIVIPAGIRDMKEEGGRVEKDSVNSMYASLLRNAKSMTKGADTNPLFDSVHYTIQKRVIEIYEYIASMVQGKRGFFEGKYSHRNIARGTRNVVAASDMDAESPDSPQYHKTTETKIPLFQASKAGANYIVYWYKTLFYDQVVSMSSENVPLINTKTLQLEYVPLDAKDKDRMTTAEGIEKTIDRFRDPFNRFKPVTVQSNGKPYYLYLIYDRGDRINLVRNVAEFKRELSDAKISFDEKLLRPITQAEMLYMAAFAAYQGTHGTVTRYPVTDEQSIYVSRTHLMTTSPSRIVRLCREVVDNPTDIILPEYPIEGKKFVDAMMMHPTRLKSLNADFDGNCLVGETKIEVRYTDCWFKKCCNLLKKKSFNSKGAKGFSDVDNESLLKRIDNHIYAVQEGWNYAEIRLDMIPQFGRYMLDKNGARVYDLPEGLEVLSYYKGSGIYRPVEKVTVEDNCNVATIKVAGKSATVSTNPSCAVFNTVTGNLKKVSPGCLKKAYVPFISRPARFKVAEASFRAGYDAAVVLVDALEYMNPMFLRGYNDEFVVGYFVGIVEKFCAVSDNYTKSMGFKIDFRITSDECREQVEKLLYLVGIRYTTTIEEGVEYIHAFGGDLLRWKKYIKFNDPTIQRNYSRFVNNRVDFTYDPIPVTNKEKKLLVELSRRNSLDDAMKFSLPGVIAYGRKLLKKYVKNDNTPLANRVYNEDVRWGTATVTKRAGKRTVYDLIVPDSKVFAVNNGLVVFDTCSWIPIFSKEANEECEQYMHTAGNYTLPSGEPLANICDDLTKISFHAITRDTPELKK